jgi:hypothetical protein
MASTILTLLQVNREARYGLMARYFSPFNLGSIDPYHSASLLINYETDIIYFRIGIMSYALTPELFSQVFGKAEEGVKNNLRRLAGNDRFWRNMISTHNGTPFDFDKFSSFKKLEEVIIVPLLEQRLDICNGLPRLERFEECEPRTHYEASYVPWFNEGFNSPPRGFPISAKLCKEITKQEWASSL